MCEMIYDKLSGIIRRDVDETSCKMYIYKGVRLFKCLSSRHSTYYVSRGCNHCNKDSTSTQQPANLVRDSNESVLKTVVSG